MKSLVVLTFIFTLPAFAQNLTGAKLIKKVEIGEVPSFFFKVNGDGTQIAYTIPTPGERASMPGTNKIIDINTKMITLIPGPHDPVYIGDLNLIITPTPTHTVYEIFRVENLLKGDKSVTASVTSLKGYYQSAGVLKTEGDVSTIRVIAERWSRNHTVIDFTYNKSGEFTIDDSYDRILCANANFKLPMLSKDGRFVGGLDNDTGLSAIWEINENYQCNKVVDLGKKTGKLNFSYDNSKVTYHIYKPVGAPDADNSENYVPLPDATFVADVYVVDLKTKVHKRLTKNGSSNSLYPDFIKNGEIVFVNHPHDKKEKVNFVFVKP